MDPNPYEPPREPIERQKQRQGARYEWGVWGLLLWLFGIGLVIVVIDLLSMQISIWMGNR